MACKVVPKSKALNSKGKLRPGHRYRKGGVIVKCTKPKGAR